MTQKSVCPYFTQCGGCLYQDLSDSDYVAKKTSFITRCFADKNISLTLDDFIRIPAGTRRRACFAFYKGVVGFNALKSHKIIPIDVCPLLTPALSNFLPALKGFIASIGSTGDIFVRDTPFGIDMHIKSGGRPLTLKLSEKLSIFAATEHLSRLMWNAVPVLEQIHFPFPTESFFQPSAEGEKTLVSLVTDTLTGVNKAVDLFCGLGTFTRPLAERKIHVTGYDSFPDGLSILPPNTVQRDLFRNPLTTEELKGLDLVVMDPPRAGALAQTVQLADSDVRKIVFISCNPVTAARDAAVLLNNGWQLQKAVAIDQFIYSNHIELCLVFSRY